MADKLSDKYPNIVTITSAVGTVYSKYHQTIIMSIIAAFVLMVTLAWNDVVQTTLARYVPKSDGDNLRGKIEYATTITILVIILQVYVFPYFVDDNKKC